MVTAKGGGARANLWNLLREAAEDDDDDEEEDEEKKEEEFNQSRVVCCEFG